ncbi:unnamed protein product [Pocillopora meandrina]|uniref:Uncharacterized protein n=1 Tax=Pocillopora meandrina TaxID=46732 RepID=A0AAU9X2X8_9CNID|nr:unnamed protein product [Pocillopora meandrina]
MHRIKKIKTYTVNYIDEEFCDCQVPCSHTKYTTEVSYSKFPDQGTAEMMIVEGYYDYVPYQRDNLVFLQVGFKSLSYEKHEQKPAYDWIPMFGEIGGNMGLFLGCSLLTICHLLLSLVLRRKRRAPHPA